MLRIITILLVCVVAVWTIRVPTEANIANRLQSRRGMLTSFGALAAISTVPAAQALTPREQARADLLAKAAVEREKERVAELPISKVKSARVSLGQATSLLENGEWSSLRDAVQAGQRVFQGQNKLIKEVALKEDISELTTTLLAKLLVVDRFAYDRQLELPAVLSGYCAEGVVPRDEPGACKPRPSKDVAVPTSALKEALASFDAIIAKCD